MVPESRDTARNSSGLEIDARALHECACLYAFSPVPFISMRYSHFTQYVQPAPATMKVNFDPRLSTQHDYSRYRLVRYRIRREIGYNAMLSVCMCVCVSVENRLEREIAYSADFFRSQVPRTKRYPVYKAVYSTPKSNFDYT